MAALNHSIIFYLLLSGCSYANGQFDLDIDNNLSNCIQINNSKVILKKEIPLLKIDYSINKHLSECGCKSAIAEYSSTLKLDGYDSVLLSAKFIFPENDIIHLPVSTSKRMIGENKLNIQLSCSAPE